jgi:hypothetical protein
MGYIRIPRHRFNVPGYAVTLEIICLASATVETYAAAHHVLVPVTNQFEIEPIGCRVPGNGK